MLCSQSLIHVDNVVAVENLTQGHKVEQKGVRTLEQGNYFDLLLGFSLN